MDTNGLLTEILHTLQRTTAIPPEVPPGEYCPLIRGACVKHRCKFWVRINGKHPQTGDPIERDDCALSWWPMLQVESTAQFMQMKDVLVQQQERIDEKMAASKEAITQGVGNLVEMKRLETIARLEA